MKQLLFFITLIFLIPFSVFSQDIGSKTLKEIRVKQIENIGNPELWDMGRLKTDIEPENDLLPFKKGAFPVPPYNSLLGFNYRGGGSITSQFARSMDEYRLMVEDKEIGFFSLHIGNSEMYSEEERNSTFFTLLTVIDTIDEKTNFSLGASNFLSRNHPDYGGQGSFITKNNKLEFVAFTTPDKGSFAIVNMRLFHLEYGNIILVTPQKDGSFRSLQIHGEVPTDENIFNYLRDEVLKSENVIKFLIDDGVI